MEDNYAVAMIDDNRFDLVVDGMPLILKVNDTAHCFDTLSFAVMHTTNRDLVVWGRRADQVAAEILYHKSLKLSPGGIYHLDKSDG